MVLSYEEFKKQREAGKSIGQIAADPANRAQKTYPTVEELIQPIKTTAETTPPALRATSPDKGRQTVDSTPQEAAGTPQTVEAGRAATQGRPYGLTAGAAENTQGRTAEQIQQELNDSQSRYKQLLLSATYAANAQESAEISRQIKAEQERIQNLKSELEPLTVPNTNTERDSLIQRMNDITANEGYATTVEQADAVQQEKQDTRQRLHELDEELGNAARFYDSGERAGAVTKGALKQTGASFTKLLSTTMGANNQLYERSPELYKATVTGGQPWLLPEDYSPDAEKMREDYQQINDKAVALNESAAKDIAQAKEGLSALGQAGVDISVNLIQMGIDAAGKYAGLGMIPFFLRASGGAMLEAEQDGADSWGQLGYGLTKGAIEVGTEKLFDGLAGIFGKGAADDVIEGLIGKLTGSNTGRTLLRAFAGAAGEGTEEVISDLLDPFAKLIYNDQALKEAWENRADLRGQMLYDYLIGAAMGGFGSVASIATGQDAEKNARLAGAETQGQTAAQPVQQAGETPPPALREERAATQGRPYGPDNGRQEGATPQTAAAERATARVAPTALTRGAMESVPVNTRQEVQAQAAETAQETQRATAGAETQPTAQNASQAASDGLNTQKRFNASQSGFGSIAPLQQNIDNGRPADYNDPVRMNGGAENGIRATGLQQNDAGRSTETNRHGLPGGYQGSNSNNSGRGRSGEVPVGTGFVLISENARKRLNERGVAVVEARDASNDKAAFSYALENARTNNLDNGWAVTPKSAEELEKSGARLMMDKQGSAGLAVAPDGDIEAVFANHAAGAPKGATKSLIPLAIANGGTKLDCYGEELVSLYAKYGFFPVARVKFDPQYANPGWDSSKGTPDIFFMMHNGDSADTVVEKIGTYPIPTKAELEALPEMDYDSAYAYRDRLLEQIKFQPKNAEAEAQFDEFTQRYGAIPTGETPARDVQVPQRISEEEAVGRTARTIMEAAATPDSRLGSVREAVVDGKFAYTEISNQQLADDAAQRIQYDGWDKSLNDWTAKVRQNQADEKLAAMGAQLLNNAGNSNMSAEQYIDLATDYNRLMHNLGRGLAAARILKTLSPEGKLYGIQRSIQNMVDEANGKYNVEIDPALIDEYRAQTTDEGRDAVISKMQQNIADQIPSTWMDKFTALRYTNMLGNFKTQIRNVGGNILMTLGRTVKDKLAAVIESAASAASGGQVERTKSLWAGTPLYGEAMRDFTNVEREAMGESKYSDSGREFDRSVQEKRTIFKNNGKWGTDEAKTGLGRSAVSKGARKVSDIGMSGMEAYRKATNWAMEQGDRIFVRLNYADALAGWLKAHGISSISEADTDTLNRARQYAIKQAQEATFRDTNSVSKFASTFDKGWGKTGFGRGAKKVMQGISPFRKTPANVAVRAEEYSPLGVLNTAYKAIEAKQGKNDVTWADVIDSAAKTLTGSGIYLLGYLMAAAGSARGKEEDEKKSAFENMRGLQDYSIILPNGKSISMDWVAPYSIPFFMGVLTQEATADGGLSWDDVGKILGAVSDPMLEMSMLSGLNDALDNISRYNGDADALPQFSMNSFASYLSQGLTNTLLGQFEQASQETRQTTYTDPESKIPSSLQYILGKSSAKTPGVDYNQQDYIDAWGRTQSTGSLGKRVINSFINPSYVNEDRSTPVDDELQRLYDAGQTNVLPQKASRSTTVNGERLSPEEYETYSITKGQQSLELVQDFIESDAYQDMSDEARAKVISDLYSFAASRAAKEIADGRKESYTSDWDDEAELSDVVGYLTSKSQIKDAQDSKDYTLLDALIDTVTEQKEDVQEKLNKDFSMLDELIYGKERGVDSKTIYTAKDKADTNGNGNISQEELWYYLGLQKNMPARTKSVLWDILTTGKTGYSAYAEKQK